MSEISLVQMKAGQTAAIKEITGGHRAAERLEAIGIRVGKKITMISSHFWKGPVTVLSGNTKVAIGHGMAKKIIVEG